MIPIPIDYLTNFSKNNLCLFVTLYVSTYLFTIIDVLYNTIIY